MTLDAMIAWLQELRQTGTPGAAVVMSWDPDAADSRPVTGAVIGQGTVQLHTDSDACQVAGFTYCAQCGGDCSSRHFACAREPELFFCADCFKTTACGSQVHGSKCPQEYRAVA